MATRTVRFLWLALIAIIATQPATAMADDGLPSLADVMARDAQLHDLAFVDGRHGWAVGDRGVILRTVDGGRRWQPLNSPVDCPLYSVAFLDHRRGWAVGGTVTPYTHTSHAVVLRTDDGGESWRPMPAETLPLLRHVQFFDARNGVAAGAGTALAPSGLFETTDGGRSWQPLPTEAPSHWNAACLLSPGVGVLAGDRGQLATLSRRKVEPSLTLAGDRRGLRDVQLIAPSQGWMVGDGGLVLTTSDLGKTWRPPTGATPSATRTLCDWKSVAVDGANVWIVGAPGSAVLHSPDGGKSWQRQPTGIAAPLSAVTFVDKRRGWAAGALGTILATTDGGRSWQVQRRGGAKMSVAVVTPDAASAPLDLLASLAAADGYLTSVDVAFAPHQSETSSSVASRLREACIASGASLTNVGWRVDSETSGVAVKHDALPASEKQLVTRLRTLRPEVVVLTAQQLDRLTAAEQLLQQAMRDAVEIAADQTRYRELAEWGLSPHRVKRIVVASAADRRSSPRIATGDFESRLGTSPAQWIGSARGLLTRRYTPPPMAVTWRVIADTALATSTGRSPMAGIAIPPGGRDGSGARRVEARPAAGELATLRDIALKRRDMQQLLAQQTSDEAWRTQVVNLTSGLNADSGAELLYQLADGYRRSGKLDLAADTFYLLARRYTEHPLSESSLVWLLHYYASSEVAHASLDAAKRFARQRPLANITSDAMPATTPPDELAASSGDGVLTRDDRLERASQLGTYLSQARPVVFADPAIRFAMAAAERGLGRGKEAEQTATVLAGRAIAADWRRVAEAERWLASPTTESGARRLLPAKAIAHCSTAETRPQLDGMLDEPCWQKVERLSIGEGGGAGVVLLTRDAEFLYVAIECPQKRGVSYPAAAGPRQRDADLAAFDRVTLHFDTDRDYATALKLTIDSRGWTADRCWGNQPWDPAWYVAASDSAERWTAEVAIPLAMLSADAASLPPGWALGITRHVPGQPTASWTGHGDSRSPDRFGLLLFE